MQKELGQQNLQEIGELLFELLTADISEVQRRTGWIIFERKLRKYYSKQKNIDSRLRGNDNPPPQVRGLTTSRK